MEITVNFKIADVRLRNRILRSFSSDYDVLAVLDNGEYIWTRVLVAANAEDILEAVQESLKKRLFLKIRWLDEVLKKPLETRDNFADRQAGMCLRFAAIGLQGKVTVEA